METVNPDDREQTYTVHCANEPCNCEVTAPMSSEAYCSQYCQSADEGEETYDCGCGHPPCDTP